MKEQKNRKIVQRFFIMLLSVLLLGWSLFASSHTKIRTLDLSGIDIGSLGEGYVYVIDALNYEKDNKQAVKNDITLSGWFLKTGEETQNVSLKVVFRNTSTDNYYIVPTEMSARQDVTAHFNDGHNYDNSGFQVKIPHGSQIDTDQYDFEIYILCVQNMSIRIISLETTLKTWEIKMRSGRIKAEEGA